MRQREKMGDIEKEKRVCKEERRAKSSVLQIWTDQQKNKRKNNEREQERKDYMKILDQQSQPIH